MTIAVANRTKIAVGLETLGYAVPPTGAAAYTYLQYAGEDLEQAQDAIESQQIQPVRDLVDTVRTRIRAQGTIQHEWLAGNTDFLIKAALQSPALTGASTIANALTTVAFTASTKTMSGPTWVGGAPVVGRYVRVSGSPKNSGIYRVTSSTTTTIVLGGKAVVDETAGATVTVALLGYYQLNEVESSFSIEKQFANVTTPSNLYQLLSGCQIDTMTIGLANGIVSGSYGWIGKNAIYSASSTGTAPVAAASNPVFNVVDNVFCLANGALIPTTGFTWNLANNLRPQNEQIGTPYAVGVGNGGPKLSGTITAYFEQAAQMDDFTNNVFRELGFIFMDSAGKGYAVEMPRVKYLTGKTVAGAKDTDVIADVGWFAMKADAAYGLRIHATGP